MIQPVNVYNPRVVFREANEAYKTSSDNTISVGKLINSGGLSLAVGGLATVISRSYTSSWSQAVALGFCSTVLSMFFLTPQWFQKSSSKKMIQQGDSFIKEKKVATAVKGSLKSSVKLLPFKQN